MKTFRKTIPPEEPTPHLDLIVRGGKIVTPDGVTRGDISPHRRRPNG